MTIPKTVTRFLADQGVDYRVVQHPRTVTASRTAQAAHISGDRIAKGVLVKDAGGYALTVLPASHTLSLSELHEKYHRRFELAPENDLKKVFPDCELGAVPAVGWPYEIETIVDESLFDEPEIYFEAGDHEELIGMSTDQFKRLLMDAPVDHISVHKQ